MAWFLSSPLNGVIYFIIWRSLCYVVIWQLFSRGSRGDFDGSYHDTFSGSNHDPFTEFHRQNDGHFSSKFYKIFSEVFSVTSNTFPSTCHFTTDYGVPLILLDFRFLDKTQICVQMILRFVLKPDSLSF